MDAEVAARMERILRINVCMCIYEEAVERPSAWRHTHLVTGAGAFSTVGAS